jgi:hypothetical protein
MEERDYWPCKTAAPVVPSYMPRFQGEGAQTRGSSDLARTVRQDLPEIMIVGSLKDSKNITRA